MSYPLSLVDFKSWLESKDKKEIVGWQGDCNGCPIFKCLMDKSFNISSVNYESTHFLDNRFDNPEWVKIFIGQVNNREIIPLKQGEINASITAQQALEVLDNLHICTVCNKYNPEGKNCGKDNCDW